MPDGGVPSPNGAWDAGESGNGMEPDGGTPSGARDAGALCEREACNPEGSTGCNAPQRCVLTPEGARCAERSSASREQGMSCGESAECAAGLACFRSGDGGVCARVCCPGGSGCEAPERRCRPAPLSDGTDTSWGGCLQPEPCDVLRPVETCGPGEACYIVSARGETGCRGTGSASVGETCDQQHDCEPGLSCVGLEQATCVRVCGIGKQDTVSCPRDEGRCRVYSQSPRGTGLCARMPAAP